MSRRRCLVITVCPNEPGVVVLPLERGGRTAERRDRVAASRVGERRVESGCRRVFMSRTRPVVARIARVHV